MDPFLHDSNKEGSIKSENNEGEEPMSETIYKSKLIHPNTWCINGEGCSAYLLVGDKCGLVIDTGFAVENIRAYVQTLTEKPVDMVVNTHGHFDHTAGNGRFPQVYMNERALPAAKTPYPSLNPSDYIVDYPVTFVGDGYCFDLGDRKVEVIEIPGHSMGDIALLDKKGRILFSGDEVGDRVAFIWMQNEPQPTVEQHFRNMQKLSSRKDEFDHVCFGHNEGCQMTDASIIEDYLENDIRIMSGMEGEKSSPQKDETGKEKDDKPKDFFMPQPEFKRFSSYKNIGLIYDIRYVYDRHVKSVTAITEVFPDGQKVTAAAVEYDAVIDNSRLSASAFSVEGRTITKVYANHSAAKAEQDRDCRDGSYVILELSADDKEASTIGVIRQGREAKAIRESVKIRVTQTGNVITNRGELLAANSDTVTNDREINLVADSFVKREFKDPKTGTALRYNLFIPEGYDINKSYPLVVFIHDRSVCSSEYDLGLVQGLGGVIWATPSEQAKHECFVLVPQYPDAIVNDDFVATVHLDVTVELIHTIVNQYSIDRNRLYATGQSMGTMSLLEMSIRYPGMFKAMLLAAGQWNPAAIHALAYNKMWVLVSEGDTRAFCGMNDCMASLEAAGARISRAKWDGRLRGTEAAALVKHVIEEGNNIKYTVYEKGTVVPVEEQGKEDMPEMFQNHIHTWRLVFTIEALRDWLFEQG